MNSATNIREILNDFFLSGMTGDTLTIIQILFNMGAALLIGLLIFVVYRVTHTGEVYSARFNVSLVMLVLVTTIVMTAIGSNVALSLGLVGALSIVRFRTVIRDSRDTMFIFWCVAVGVCCGVSSYVLALVGSMFVFLYLMVCGMIRENERILIIIRGTAQSLNDAERVVAQHYAQKAVLRVTNINSAEGTGEAIYEIASNVREKYDRSGGTVESLLVGTRGISSISIVRQEDEVSQ
ncbi:MAG: DUF4956 domain-containing protein [Clostridia bacterium]|nr:DUF4956 domain-containing protein [Clostridia bacterium]